MSDLDRARARTFALRLAYGPQSNLDNAVREDFSKTLAKVGTPKKPKRGPGSSPSSPSPATAGRGEISFCGTTSASAHEPARAVRRPPGGPGTGAQGPAAAARARKAREAASTNASGGRDLHGFSKNGRHKSKAIGTASRSARSRAIPIRSLDATRAAIVQSIEISPSKAPERSQDRASIADAGGSWFPTPWCCTTRRGLPGSIGAISTVESGEPSGAEIDTTCAPERQAES